MDVKSLYKMLQKQRAETADSDKDEDELRVIAESAYKKGNSDLRRKLYREIVKKINSFGGMRALHQRFKKERRALIDLGNQSNAMSDLYFKVCARYIPMLEEQRQRNFETLKHAILGDGEAEMHHEFVRSMELDDIAKKIDYERACNRGLYGRQKELPQGLLDLTIEDLE